MLKSNPRGEEYFNINSIYTSPLASIVIKIVVLLLHIVDFQQGDLMRHFSVFYLFVLIFVLILIFEIFNFIYKFYFILLLILVLIFFSIFVLFGAVLLRFFLFVYARYLHDTDTDWSRNQKNNTHTSKIETL